MVEVFDLPQAEHKTIYPTPRGGAVVARRAHNPKVVGSNPTPATNERKRQEVDRRSRPAFFVCVDGEVDLRSLVKGFLRSVRKCYLGSLKFEDAYKGHIKASPVDNPRMRQGMSLTK